jgi:Novel STAND NTPase 1
MSTSPPDAPAAVAIAAPPLPDAPYPGIEPFRFLDHQIFTARDEETWTLLSNVTIYRAVLLYGASGTGKSSLINAGLLPQVLKENQLPDRIRVQPFAGREIKVERIRMSGEKEQAAYLPSNFAPPESDASSETIELSLAAFRQRLEQFRPQPNATEDTSARTQTPRPLLIFDQFEEFITLFEEAQRVGTAAETRRALELVPEAQQEILTTLVELIQDETLPIKIIFSFREDYLAKLSLLFEHCPELLDQAQRLLPPSIEALPRIIRAPFIDPELRQHFLRQQDQTGSELSEALAQRIGDELGRRSEGGTANLTELQIVCQRLWQAPDPEKLFANDGIEGLLKEYGADVFRHFTPKLRDPAIVLLSQMITASNTRNIVSEEDLLNRSAGFDFDPSLCSAALAALGRSQIVRREPRHNIYFYEITSEYLVPWIKERVAERKSAEERRLAETAQQRLEAERAQAVRKFETEQRRAFIFRRVLTVTMLLMVVVVFLGMFAYRQYRNAKAAEATATLARQETEHILKALTLVTSQKPGENLEGIAQFDALVKENQIPPDLASVVIQPVLASKDAKVHQAGYDFLLRIEQTNPNVAQSVVQAAQTNDGLAEKIPPRFYIHIADESQRAQAQQMAAFLKKQGYLVPGIQNVGEKGVRHNQLRYFRDSEPGIPTPQEIITVLDKANVGKWSLNRVRGYEQSTKVVPGQFELWFASVPTNQPDANRVTEPEGQLVLQLFDQNGSPLKGVPHVKIEAVADAFYETKNASGTTFSLDPGDYRVTVDLDDYGIIDNRVSIKPRETTTLRLLLKSKRWFRAR